MPAPIEGSWLDAFVEVLERCGVRRGDACAVLAESQSRTVLPELAMLALHRLGAVAFLARVPTPAPLPGPPVRSTGASMALRGQGALVEALARSTLVVDCSVEGLQHAAELPAILAGGARVLGVSNEHPEILLRCLPQAGDEAQAREAMRALRGARQMTVRSGAGTDLAIEMAGARIGGVWGYTQRPGSLTHWPGGLVVAFPAAGCVNGVLVLDRGDANLSFKRYLADPVRLQIADDHVVEVVGDSTDAQMLRRCYADWGDAAARAVSHVGWGLNRRARWDAMAYYDKADFNGTELRAVAGSFLYSTGANEVAGRHTTGHFDLPLRGCTVELDGHLVVREGHLLS